MKFVCVAGLICCSLLCANVQRASAWAVSQASAPQSQTPSQAASTAATTSSIGLAVGQNAPSFSGVDQLGREQTNATVRGSKGTVLVFFRSADW